MPDHQYKQRTANKRTERRIESASEVSAVCFLMENGTTVRGWDDSSSRNRASKGESTTDLEDIDFADRIKNVDCEMIM